jgi:hypothetical protein
VKDKLYTVHCTVYKEKESGNRKGEVVQLTEHGLFGEQVAHSEQMRLTGEHKRLYSREARMDSEQIRQFSEQ